jgi:hypothetical protein
MRSKTNTVGDAVSKQEKTEMESIGAAEGARSASGTASIEAPKQGALAPGQRWSVRRKRDVVLRMLRGEPAAKLSRELGVEIYRLEQWRDQAVAGLEVGLRDRDPDDPAQRDLDAAKRHIGELSMENELLRERARAAEARLPLGTRRSRS